jgi:putative transposase
MIEIVNPELSISKQCEMVNIPRSTFYESIKPIELSDSDIKQHIIAIYTENPVYGSRRITAMLKRKEININRKKVQRLMRELKLQGICPKRNLSIPNIAHKIYPYIARDQAITQINQVWSSDITYVNTKFGTVYLVAILDWHSRFVYSWEMSNTMGEEFCISALETALKYGNPGIFNTDQGSQFTGNSFISMLLKHDIRPSMDGKGRATDNAPSERLWRTVKWEEIYLHEPKDFKDLQQQVNRFMRYYNHERPHQSLEYLTPSEAHFNLKKKLIDNNYKLIYTEREIEIVSKRYNFIT